MANAKQELALEIVEALLAYRERGDFLDKQSIMDTEPYENAWLEYNKAWDVVDEKLDDYEKRFKK